LNAWESGRQGGQENWPRKTVLLQEAGVIIEISVNPASQNHAFVLPNLEWAWILLSMVLLVRTREQHRLEHWGIEAARKAWEKTLMKTDSK
jgi:hypothetical protein